MLTRCVVNSSLRMVDVFSCDYLVSSCGFEVKEINGEAVYHLTEVNARLNAIRSYLQDYLAKGAGLILFLYESL